MISQKSERRIKDFLEAYAPEPASTILLAEDETIAALVKPPVSLNEETVRYARAHQ